MRTLNKILDGCNLVLVGIAGIIIFYLLVSVCFATLSRYLVNQPHAYLIDYAAYSLIYIAFLGSPWLYGKRGHITVDLFLEKVSARKKQIWIGLTDIAVLIIAVVLFYISFKVTRNSFVNGVRVSDFLNTPKWLLLVPIPVSMFFIAIQAIRNAAASFFPKKVEEGGEQ
jgi:C4-dicarboxylate transporter DctQ subunit